ncbi:uncharacterized protein CDAR_299181 [Caerostris darwini]|uniref:Gustatory receptor n=1 Tax=Caerostris darwini TaxID=1538125 RepID=A0AAV4PC47_9ARAC|nr:uncharacterized protein CDAR_299181 [Caerostris darwini]
MSTFDVLAAGAWEYSRSWDGLRGLLLTCSIGERTVTIRKTTVPGKIIYSHKLTNFSNSIFYPFIYVNQFFTLWIWWIIFKKRHEFLDFAALGKDLQQRLAHFGQQTNHRRRKCWMICLIGPLTPCVVFLSIKPLYYENLFYVTSWIPERYKGLRIFFSVIDIGVDTYNAFGLPLILMIFYIAHCFELASLSTKITNCLKKSSRLCENLVYMVNKYFSLFAELEELMSFPIGFIVMRITLEVFRFMFHLFQLDTVQDNLSVSSVLVFLFVLVNVSADLAQCRALSLRKALMKVIITNSQMLSDSEFNKQYILFKESENEAHLSAWKVFTLNRSFVLNTVAFFFSYAVIMAQIPSGSSQCCSEVN